jgi:hypothetical protein
MFPAGPQAELDRYIGYWEPYATSHQALDEDTAVQGEVRNAAKSLAEALAAQRAGKFVISGSTVRVRAHPPIDPVEIKGRSGSFGFLGGLCFVCGTPPQSKWRARREQRRKLFICRRGDCPADCRQFRRTESRVRASMK